MFKQLESDHQFDMFCFSKIVHFQYMSGSALTYQDTSKASFDNTNLRTLRNLQDLLIDLNGHIITFHHPSVSEDRTSDVEGAKLSSLTCRKAGCKLSRWHVVTTSKFPVTHLAIAKFDDLKNVSETDVACSWNFTCY